MGIRLSGIRVPCQDPKTKMSKGTHQVTAAQPLLAKLAVPPWVCQFFGECSTNSKVLIAHIIVTTIAVALVITTTLLQKRSRAIAIMIL